MCLTCHKFQTNTLRLIKKKLFQPCVDRIRDEMTEVAWKFREFSSSKHTKCCLDKYNLSVSAIFKRVIQLRTSYKNMKDNYEPSGYAPGYFQIKWHTQGLGFIKLQCFKNKMCSNHISKTCQVKAGLTKWHSATAPCEKKSSCFQTTLFSTLKIIGSSIH